MNPDYILSYGAMPWYNPFRPNLMFRPKLGASDNATRAKRKKERQARKRNR